MGFLKSITTFPCKINDFQINLHFFHDCNQKPIFKLNTYADNAKRRQCKSEKKNSRPNGRGVTRPADHHQEVGEILLFAGSVSVG